MNITVLPLLIVALLMAAGDPGVQSIDVLVSGQHELTVDDDAVVVGDAAVVVADGAEASGPLYVIGGQLQISGTVAGDVVQLAGTVRVDPTATIDGELRHIGGTQEVAAGAAIASRTTLPVATGGTSTTSSLVSWAIGTLVLAAVAVRLGRRRTRALDNVGRAATEHPVITLTVGLLVAVTMTSVFALMAFTLVLLPVVILGILAGIAVVAYAVIALGHAVAARLPRVDPRWSTALGVVVVMMAIQVVGVVPVVGDLVALAIMLTGLGAVMVTSFGLSRFHPDVLPD